MLATKEWPAVAMRYLIIKNIAFCLRRSESVSLSRRQTKVRLMRLRKMKDGCRAPRALCQPTGFVASTKLVK